MTGCLQVGRPLEPDDPDAARDDQLVDHPHRTRHLPQDPSRPADAGEHELPTQDYGMPASSAISATDSATSPITRASWPARRLRSMLTLFETGSGAHPCKINRIGGLEAGRFPPSSNATREEAVMTETLKGACL